MFSDENTWTRLYKTVYKVSGSGTAYVYRVDANDRPIKPHARKYTVHEDLVETIRADLGSGDYWVLIRDGRVLVFSGGIGYAKRIGE